MPSPSTSYPDPEVDTVTELPSVRVTVVVVREPYPWPMLFKLITASPCDANTDANETQEFLFAFAPVPHMTTGHPVNGCAPAGIHRLNATCTRRGAGRVPVRVGIIGRCPEPRTVKSSVCRLPKASRPTELGTMCRFLIAFDSGCGVNAPCTRT